MPLYYKPISKRMPNFYKNLLRSSGSTILITVDWESFNAWNSRSICILCENPHIQYDLSCCRAKDVCVFYTNNKDLPQAMRIGQEAQREGAKFVLLKPTMQEVEGYDEL